MSVGQCFSSIHHHTLAEDVLNLAEASNSKSRRPLGRLAIALLIRV